MTVNSALLLPPCDKNIIPKNFSQDEVFLPSAPKNETLSDWINTLVFENQPRIIFGSDSTTSLAWLAATRKYPNTRALIWQANEQQWQDIHTLDFWNPEATDKSPTEIETNTSVETEVISTPSKSNVQQTEANVKKQTTNIQKPNSSVKKKPKSQKHGSYSGVTSFKQMDDKKLLHEIFKFCAWGPKPENISKVRDAKFEAGRRADTDASIANRAAHMEELGTLAHSLANQAVKELKKLFPTKGQLAYEDALAWAESQKNGKHNKVNYHLTIQLKSALDYLENGKKSAQKAKQAKQNQPNSTLAPVKLIDGIHPNSLRHLEPSEHWTIAIDETGDKFSPNAQNLSPLDRKLGKVVALVIPQKNYDQLKDLPKRFHATESNDEALKNKIVQALTRTDVGILGFSVQDPAHTINQQWFDAIHKLCEWTLLMLPVNDHQPLVVEIQIEQRGGCIVGDGQLELIKETTLNRLKTIAPKRFEKLHLLMEFVDKNGSKFNGYVDSICNAWGSPSKLAKQRLKQSKWLNHCLLSAQQDNIQRLFLAVNENQTLTKEAWYQICGEVMSEPKTSLLHTLLDLVGQQTQQDEALWMTYMDFISERLRLKDYKLKAIGYALDWMEEHKPEHSELPLIAQLYWHSAKLAQLNHEGKLDIQRLQTLINIADSLREEYAQDSCQALLRVSTAMTNGFEFKAATPSLQKWLEYNVAIPGRLNHAKLLSTMGQLSAFNSDSKKAVDYFNQAIAQFKQLSHQQMAQKDIRQTQTYHSIASMDQLNTTNANEWQSNIIIDPQQIKSLAVSGSLERYKHHTFLRGLIHAPDTFAETIKTYLSNETQWEIGDSHPWQWINAYRGWLFFLQGDRNKAKEYFHIAVEQTLDSKGVTIEWIGAVIATLSDKLEVTENLSSSFDLEKLHKKIPNAPLDVLDTWQCETAIETHQQILLRLKNLVPFNFH